MDVTTSYTICCRSDAHRVEEPAIIRFGERAGEAITTTVNRCVVCNAAAPKMVHIETRNSRKGTKTECGAACLGGKVSCDCRCNGRCHGADKCLCGEVA